MSKINGFTRFCAKEIVEKYLIDLAREPRQCRSETTPEIVLGGGLDFYHSDRERLCRDLPRSAQGTSPRLWSYTPSYSYSSVCIPPAIESLLARSAVSNCANQLRDHYWDLITLLEKTRHPRNVVEAYQSLHIITQFFESSCRNLYFFPRFYGGEVTPTVGNAVEVQSLDGKRFLFEDPEMMFYLPAAFAAAYLNASLDYFTYPDRLLQEKPVWHTTFESALRQSDWPLIHGLLGIVAHIVQDLPDAISTTLKMILQRRFRETDPLKIVLRFAQNVIDTVGDDFYSSRFRAVTEEITSQSFQENWPIAYRWMNLAAQNIVFSSFKADHDHIDAVLRYLMEDTLEVLDDPLTQLFRHLNHVSEGAIYEIGYFVIEKMRARAWTHMLQLYNAHTEEERKSIMKEIRQEALTFANFLLQDPIEFDLDEESRDQILLKISSTGLRNLYQLFRKENFQIGDVKVQLEYKMENWKLSLSMINSPFQNFLRHMQQAKISISSGNRKKIVVVRFPKK